MGKKGYRVSVNYDESVEEAVRTGRYDWVDRNINSRNFSTDRSGSKRVEMKLVHFGRAISSREALKELDRMGYRPAELHELLAFGRDYPKIQRKLPVVGLASVWRKDRAGSRVPLLDRNGSERDLYLHWFGGDWPEDCRFAALSK